MLNVGNRNMYKYPTGRYDMAALLHKRLWLCY